MHGLRLLQAQRGSLVYDRGCLNCALLLFRTSLRLAPALASRQKHTLPDLPYDYGALQPHINAEIMQLHHSKHHATYVSNLNIAEEKYAEALAKGKRRKALCELGGLWTLVQLKSSPSQGELIVRSLFL